MVDLENGENDHCPLKLSPDSTEPLQSHCGGGENGGANCVTCATKARLYLKGEKTELTMTEKERLLESIKQHEVIFNPEHPSRSVRDLVTSAWEDVAEKTGFPVELCKEAWRKIKLAYQNSQRHARSKVNADGSIRKPYYLHKQMTFYEPHLRARDVMNQLVKVDQQAAQELNQRNHNSVSLQGSPQPPTSQHLNNSAPSHYPNGTQCLSSPDSMRSLPSTDECKSPLALDSRISAIDAKFGGGGGGGGGEAIVSPASPPITQAHIKAIPSPPLPQHLSQEPRHREPRLLPQKRKLDPTDFFISQANNVPKFPFLPGFPHQLSPLDAAPPPPPVRQINEVAPPPLEVDADLQFLLSLHADIKSLNFRQKFGFKRKVYALMEDILNGSE